MFEAVEFYLNLGILSNEMNTYRMIRVGGITSPIFFFFFITNCEKLMVEMKIK